MTTSKKDYEKASELAKIGLEFSEDLRDSNRDYFTSLSYSYYAIAAAISLTWTKHAQFEHDFINYASGYIDGKVAYDESISKKFSLRFGREDLDNALLNYRKFYKEVKSLMPSFTSCDIHTIKNLQNRLLGKLDVLRNEGKIQGIGPWLFTGPFKIILTDQDRLWENDGIDAIILPTGMEVDRAVKRLKKEGFGFVEGFKVSWLEEESSLLDSYATYEMVQDCVSKIGHMVDSPALHINSALYLYGRNEI